VSKAIRLLPAFLTVGSWTMLSRILGFVRDIFIAAFLGSGPIAQAWFVAFALPNMFRRFFAEGAFNAAFVPLFSKKLQSGEGPADFARDAFSGMAFILLVFTILAQIAMPLLVYAMASGFSGDERFDVAVVMGRITFPYLALISLAAIASGVLNATGRFAAAAAAPVLLNIILVAAMLGAYALGADVGLALAWGAPLAGVAQLALVWIAAKRAGFALNLRRPRLTPELMRLAVIAAPAALAGGVVQVNLLVGRQVASFFDGAVAWLSMADRLYQLPLGLVGVAIGVVLLPDLSRRLADGDTQGSRNAFNRANEFALALTLPAAAALMVIAGPLISALFERGAFTSADTRATAAALVIYGAGLPAFVLLKTVTPLFFAREDTRTPFRFALWAMVINAGVAIGLAPLLGYLAAALGTTVAAWANLALLWGKARGLGVAAEVDSASRRSLPRLVLCAVIMGVVVWALALVTWPSLGEGPSRYFALAMLIAVGGGVYAGAVLATGALRVADLKASLARPGA